MSFAREVKNEILDLKLENRYLDILLSAIFNNLKNKQEIITGNVDLLNFLEYNINKRWNVQGQISRYNTKLYRLAFLKEIPLYQVDVNNNISISFYLAGLFLLTGSINSPLSVQYHLELITLNLEESNKVITMMEKFYLTPKMIKRRDRFVVYLKKSDQISDFLSIVHAESKMLEFENIRIERDFFNSTVRINNCAVSNDVKTIKTADQQIKIINRIGLNNLKGDMHILAKLRLFYVDLSYLELAQKYLEVMGKSISKAKISQLFKKMEQL